MKTETVEFGPTHRNQLVTIPGEFAYRGMVQKAQRLASNYGVIFVVDNRVLGSGTLIKTGNITGILTAHHVARVPYLKEGGEFSLCVCDGLVHRYDVKTSQFEHIVVGDHRKNHFEHSGPDLSFLMITDPEVSATLGAKKSFYPLVNHTDVSHCGAEHLRKMVWTVSGSPAEFCEGMGMYQGETLTKFSDFHASVDFLSLIRKKGFDYIRLETDAGVGDFPSDYGGMSGGAIWLPIKYETKNGDIEYPPILQGVVFYQSRPFTNGKKRLLIGHGPESIYDRLTEVLKAG